jgi:uncharacterized membrane protein YjgN (DUF898 family)
LTFWRDAIFTALSLGLYLPFLRNNMRAFLVRSTSYGDQPFEYDGKADDLFGSFLATFLLWFPTLGLIWYRFRACEFCFQMSRTSFRGSRFAAEMRGRDLLWLTLTNGLLVLATLRDSAAFGAGAGREVLL